MKIEEFTKYDLGPLRGDIRDSWKEWCQSVIGLEFGARPNQGPSRAHHFLIDNAVPYRRVLDGISKG